MRLSANKTELRKTLLQQRRALSEDERARAANEAARIFAASDLFQQSQHIACYFPFQDEFDCMPLIQTIWQQSKKCYLPIVQDNNILTFVHYAPDSVMKLNRYRIPEPINTPAISIQTLDVILLPLVGFDQKGNRLGMGAGYYDKTLNALQGRPKKIGLAYEIQQVDQLPQDDWDVPLDGVLTEKKLLLF